MIKDTRIQIGLAMVALVLMQTADLAAQTSQAIRVIARRSEDAVFVRWAPTSAQAFEEGRTAGYRLQRAVVTNGRIGSFEAWPSDTVFTPLSQERFDALAWLFRESDDQRMRYRQFARSVLFDPVDPALSSDERAAALDLQLGFALLSADRDTISAIGLGLLFADGDAAPGTAYAYRVQLANRPSDPLAADTVIVGPEIHRVRSRLSEMQIDTGDTQIGLRWQRADEYPAFMLQRSENDGASWQDLSDAPMMTLVTGDTIPEGEVHLDTNLVNGRRYTYRLYGLTSFADEELIAEFSVVPRDRTPPMMPTDIRAEELRPGVVEITWTVPDPVDADLVSFSIGRDTADEGAFPVIADRLPPATRSYIDSSGQFAASNYYRVSAVDTAGNAAHSFSAYLVLTDSTPPAVPQLLRGEIDTNGIVTLHFQRPPDADYMGYRLLRANDPTHEFSVISERLTNDTLDVSADSIHIDTIEIRTLTRYVYYRMYALDFHHNASGMTEILRVERPDVVPPVPPVIIGYLVTDSAMVIDYVGSSSEDVARHIILRKAPEAELWDSIAMLPPASGQFRDTTSAVGSVFDYVVVAVDSSDLLSEMSNSVRGQRYDNGIRPTVTDVRTQYDADAKVITLSWTYRDLPEDMAFVVYRSDGSDLTSYAVVDQRGARSFVDRSLPPTASIRYAIKVVTASGAESVLSTAVSVDLR